MDETQNQPDWASQIKTLVDHHTVHVVATRRSALRIEPGGNSLTGRFAPLALDTLLLREIAGRRTGHEIEALLPPSGLDDLLRVDFWRPLTAHGLRS